MKGFGIEIKNNLLEPKHVKKMGASVWLYMWLLDKMTSIDEDGIGKVLSGRAVIFEDTKEDLAISRRTYQRWITMLGVNGYILTERQKNGQSILVKKAWKRFGRKTEAKPEAPKPPKEVKPFVWAEYLEKMANDSRRHVNAIGHYFEEKGIRFDSEEKAQVAIRRHLRPAQQLSKFSDDEIVKATDKAKKEYPDVWTVETIVKILTR
jgi:hypothetical protein